MLERLGRGMSACDLRSNMPAINWNFGIATALPSPLSLSRASAALYQNSSGEWLSASAHQPRLGYLFGFGPGLVREETVSALNNYARPSSGAVNDHFLGSTSAQLLGRSITSINTGVTSAPTHNLNNGAYVWDIDHDISGTAELALSGGTADTDPKSIMVHYKHITGSAVTVYLKDYSGSTISIGTLGTSGSWELSRFDDVAAGNSNAHYIVLDIPEGTQIQIALVNLQDSKYCTSPIDCSEAPAARTADTISDGSADWYNAGAGTFALSYWDWAADHANDFQSYLYIGDGGNTNRIELAKNVNPEGEALVRIRLSNTTQFDYDLSALSVVNGFTNVAIAYMQDDFAFAYNNSIIATDISGTPPSNMSGGFGLGSRPNGLIPASMVIAKLSYYNTRLENNILESL
ncbi:MAG: hypothetical protein KTR28_06070 [Micavibrio sp.]|nr:hypothetical protein [Micavibrio sp.]